mgnify:FL=1|jgi:hypothetical protein
MGLKSPKKVRMQTLMHKKKLLTLHEARRAIYVDFEGTAVDPPSLLGVLWFSDSGERFFKQLILEEALWPMVVGKPRTEYGPCVKETWEGLEGLRRLSQEENRLIIAWSTHESSELAQRVDGLDGEWFSENVVNAIPIAKFWKKKAFPEVVFKKSPKKWKMGKNSLDQYMRLIDYQVPKAFGPGNSASRIRAVREMLLKKGGDYSLLTPTAKGKWTKALLHNWHDCNGMREVMIRCAEKGE